MSTLAEPAPAPRPPHPSPDDVVTAALAGDDDAFAVLVERHRREVHGHCTRMLRSPELAEDVVQETFLRAWRARGHFAGRSTFRTWLYQIATNACLDEIGRKQRRAAVGLGLGLGPGASRAAGAARRGDADGREASGPEPVAPGHDRPDVVVVAKETLALGLLSAFAVLPPRQRTVLILRDVLGWSANDTAALLGVTVPSVNSALQRARARLAVERPSRETGRTADARLGPDDRDLAERCVEALARADWAEVVDLVRPGAGTGQDAS